MVFNAEKVRQTRSKLEDEIEIEEQFQDIFRNPYSLIGSKGKTILELRKNHKSKKRKFKKRQKYELKFE